MENSSKGARSKPAQKTLSHTFKDVSKKPFLYRPGIGLGYPYSSSLIHTASPCMPPTHLSYASTRPVVRGASNSAPRPSPPSSAISRPGKWNAMHVKISWEIYNNQLKEKSTGATVTTSRPSKSCGSSPQPRHRPPPPTARPRSCPPHAFVMKPADDKPVTQRASYPYPLFRGVGTQQAQV